MLPVVVGEDGKIVTDIARDAKVKVTLVKGGPHEESALFHLVGSAEAVKTAQYMMQIKIKERLAKGEGLPGPPIPRRGTGPNRRT